MDHHHSNITDRNRAMQHQIEQQQRQIENSVNESFMQHIVADMTTLCMQRCYVDGTVPANRFMKFSMRQYLLQDDVENRLSKRAQQCLKNCANLYNECYYEVEEAVIEVGYTWIC